ncbi:MAG: DUF2190 family protein [Nitrospirota bacterium]
MANVQAINKSSSGEFRFRRMTPAADCGPMDIVVITTTDGTLVAVAFKAISANVSGMFIIDAEIIAFPQANVAIKGGDKLYWDPVNNWATNVNAAGLKLFGVAHSDSAQGNATVDCELMMEHALL